MAWKSLLPCERDKAILARMRRGRRTAAIAAAMGILTLVLTLVASRDTLLRQLESLFRDSDRTCMRILRNACDAENVAQECF